jgi:curved DNA-binding protein CbpA
MSNDQHPATDDLYRRLEVGPAASRDQIVRAYRRLAHGAHPDARPGDPGAAPRFRRLTEAYEVLADPVRRAAYDRARQAAQGQPVAGRAVPAWGPRPSPWLTGIGPVETSAPPLRAGPVHVDPAPAQPRAGTRGLVADDALTELLWALERWLR